MSEAKPAEALLVDFGGVLTSSVFDSFRSYAGGLGPDPMLVEKLLRVDTASQQALVAHETGKQPLSEFERIFSERLRAHGAEVEAEGLVAGLTADLVPDRAMIAAVARARENGIATVIVSNSLGYEAYDGYDLESLVDHVILSGQIGVRKPSRRMYAAAAEAAAVAPGSCVMIDDLPQNVSGAERAGMSGIVHETAFGTLPVLEQRFGIEFTDLLTVLEARPDDLA